MEYPFDSKFMKYLGICLILSLLAFSCKKHEDSLDSEDTISEDNRLIQVYTYDSNGVVFKIVNDVDSAAYQMQDTYGGFYYTFHYKVDSICLKNWHYNGPEDFSSENFTWFTKRGQYVCWRDVYIGKIRSEKRCDIFIPNRYKNLRKVDYLEYGGAIMTDSIAYRHPDFKLVFPEPILDTVYVKLSNMNFIYSLW
jgi:hypothetical protein